MESASQVNVPLRSGGKKMRKRRELDALVAHSLAKRANKKSNVGNGVNSQDQLLSPSTDEQEDLGWPKIVRSSSRTRNRKFSFIRMCGPLIFVSCISLSLGFMYWLYFDLRQQLYEYRQKIEEVSVTSQNLPEALQKWHETSKNLEQNQTAIYGKITELQHSLENLSSDLAQYKAKLNEKKDYSKDEKFVANFGAKIEAVTVDVEGMKERFSEFQKNQINFKNDMQQLKSNFTAAVANASMSSNNSSSNCSEEISVVKQLLLDQIKAISANLSTANDTFSQKNKGMDEELLLHKRSLEALSETVANTTSHVTSIENDWTTYKTKAINFESFSNKVDTEIMNLRNSTNFLENSVEEVRTTCNKIHTDMQHDFDELKQKSMNAKKDTPAITKVILSNEDNKTPSELSPPTTKNTEDTKKNINLDKSAFQNSTNATINSTTELVGMKR